MGEFFDLAPCIYFTSGDDGTILAANSTLCKEVEYTKEELIGKKLDVICTLPTRIFQQTHFFPLLKMQGHAEEIFITLLTKSGNYLPVLINAERTVIDEKEVTVYGGIVVHNRKKFEDELVAAKKAAEAALNENTTLMQAKKELQQHAELLDRQMTLLNKHNEELTQFSRVVTHDLQEPLRKMFVFTNMLLENPEDGSLMKTVSRIRSVSEQMRAILSGLQQYVWLTEMEVKESKVNLDHLLQQAISEVRKEHPEISLTVQTEELPEIEADKEQMKFLFHELLSNAVRFRKEGNEVQIRVSVSTLMLNQFRRLSGKYKYTEHLKIQVEDEGIGFDVEYKEQVFELFKRLHTQSGRGIGLALCRKIIENHQGIINIDSKENEGTSLTVLLPLQVQEELAPPSTHGRQQIKN